ncbi:Atu4866 domain-containing protein [Nonomuraea sp. NPDC050680]|uniref:Atu4866 domain-containing protein n=1 Tax=Nonomuraea sp. NPDC050680 TaxID=3154630 RepID=UPI0033F1F6DD
MPNENVVGMWVTADGHIRQELLPDGRYDEARGDRRSAYTGRYTVTGAHLDQKCPAPVPGTGHFSSRVRSVAAADDLHPVGGL